MQADPQYLRLCLRLARRGYGTTSPNPMVGAVLVKRGEIIGRGWHRRAGEAHAEIAALRDAQRRGRNTRGATLYVSLEPCSTHGRTPPCTEAIIQAGVRRVIVGAIDPNPRHGGHGLGILRRAGITVKSGVLAEECARLNEAFNHWIVHRLPFVTVKAAMTLDGKIATRTGESKWITGEPARALTMRLRAGVDAVVAGINTVLADDPSLTVRGRKNQREHRLRRIVLDANARTPLKARLVCDGESKLTNIVVSREAPQSRARALSKKVSVIVAPARNGQIDLRWLLKKLGAESVTSLLVEGGGEVNASFLLAGLAQRVAFFYAPKILGGANSRKAVAGSGAKGLTGALDLTDVRWRRAGEDWVLEARVKAKDGQGRMRARGLQSGNPHRGPAP
jgi:diaminohydroxyphosphoribosylaminopyrimidine deaminase/5-amino-6-(5-phosphoribosylamino)uracil reductase